MCVHSGIDLSQENSICDALDYTHLWYKHEYEEDSGQYNDPCREQCCTDVDVASQYECHQNDYN